MVKFRFTKHAEIKFKILSEHGFTLSKSTIIATIKNPDCRERGRNLRLIAQKIIDNEHVLRVIYKKKQKGITVITFYPGRRTYYED
ncbi:MAG: DUF4258 domain-containing protein [Candidatus Margulisbacteria bacterium]|nr:DUF4258 domain-containing protein [Candidatus Margulisiibacteriota bacterium]